MWENDSSAGWKRSDTVPESQYPGSIDTGKTVRLKGKGNPGFNGGEAGDLLLKVTVGDRAGFERKGMDVYTNITIPFTTAVLGGEAVVPTLTGNVVCSIRPGTQSGSKIRLRGKGIVSMKDKNIHGDEYAVVQIQVPKNTEWDSEGKTERVCESLLIKNVEKRKKCFLRKCFFLFLCGNAFFFEKNIQLAEKSGFQIDSDSSVC